jgi:hypothetical protein
MAGQHERTCDSLSDFACHSTCKRGFSRVPGMGRANDEAVCARRACDVAGDLELPVGLQPLVLLARRPRADDLVCVVQHRELRRLSTDLCHHIEERRSGRGLRRILIHCAWIDERDAEELNSLDATDIDVLQSWNTQSRLRELRESVCERSKSKRIL